MRIALLSSMMAITFAASSSPITTAAEAAAEELAVVRNGVRENACVVGGEWQRGDGFLEAGGYDHGLLADRGLDKGDFHLTARLSIHGLDKSAARFTFNRGESVSPIRRFSSCVRVNCGLPRGKAASSSNCGKRTSSTIDPVAGERIPRDNLSC